MKKSLQKKLRKITSISTLSVLCYVSAMAGEPAERTLDSAINGLSEMVKRAYTQIHQNPELGHLEYKTQAFLKMELEKLGYKHFIPSSKAPTAVIAVLDTGRPGPVIALRADMDARPLAKGEIEPETHNPRSQIPEIMHNCGHDVHSAILLGTAGVLMKNQDIVSGKIIFLFQPAEEIPGGAEDIVSEGILQNLGVEYMFAQHVFPKLPLETLLITPGAMLAGDNYFDLTITGIQSHAASPWFGSDVPLATTHIVQGLSYLAARQFDVVKRPIIISVTEIETGVGAYNVLPPKATVRGTIRAVESVTKAPQGSVRSIEQVIKNYMEGMSKAYNVNYDWLLTEGSPPMYNDPKLFNQVIKSLGQVWPGTLKSGDRFMFAEDFAFYTQQIPSLYFFLGIQKKGLGNGGLHSPEFTVHADALAYGVRLMTLIAQITTQGKVVLK